MEFFELEKSNSIATVWFNRPQKYNMMNLDFWQQLPQVLQNLQQDNSLKVVIFGGRGKHFSAGLDLADFQENFSWLGDERKNTGQAEQNQKLRHLITNMQNAINAIEEMSIPTIAAVQGYCIGGGLDFICACDIRLASADALFSLREAKVHIVADMGSLQRLPAIIGEGNTRELALTARDLKAEEALRMGLLTSVCENKDALYQQARESAEQLAQNSSLVMQGIKEVMNYGRNHGLKSSLDYVIAYNSAFLQSQPFTQSLQFLQKRKEEKAKAKRQRKLQQK